MYVGFNLKTTVLQAASAALAINLCLSKEFSATVKEDMDENGNIRMDIVSLNGNEASDYEINVTFVGNEMEMSGWGNAGDLDLDTFFDKLSVLVPLVDMNTLRGHLIEDDSEEDYLEPEELALTLPESWPVRGVQKEQESAA